MSSHICLRVHFVWSTSGREPWIDPAWTQRLYAYLGTVLQDRDGVLLAAGGVSDHVHLYTSLPSTRTLADIANVLKANSSRWVHQTIGLPKFAWQAGYGAFSVSVSGNQAVRRYLADQAEHHRLRSFQEEYLDFLNRHGVAYDPRYVLA
jgi:REP element-mobilizing transposase RayT